MGWLVLLYFLELGYAPFYNSVNVISDEYEQILRMCIIWNLM